MLCIHLIDSVGVDKSLLNTEGDSDLLRRSRLSAVSNSNKYESREKINAAAQRTLLVDSGSETDSKVCERYAAVRGGGRRAEGQEEANRSGGKTSLQREYGEIMGGRRFGRKRDQRLCGKWINKLMKTSAVRWNRDQYLTISIQNTLQWWRNSYSVPCRGPGRSRTLWKTAD